MQIGNLVQPGNISLPEETGDIQQTKRTGLNSGPDLTIESSVATGSGTGVESRQGVALDEPTVTPDEVSNSDFQSEMSSVDNSPLGLVGFAKAMQSLSEAALAVIYLISDTKVEIVKDERRDSSLTFNPSNSGNDSRRVGGSGDGDGNNVDGGTETPPSGGGGNDAAAMLDELARCAEAMCNSLYTVINSSNYPNYTDFLKLMVDSAQQLREQASAARQSALQGDFDNVMMQAEQMKVAAEKTLEAAKKTNKAEMISGAMNVVGGAATAATGFAGVKSQSAPLMGQAFGSAASGSGSIGGASVKNEAAALTNEADLANAAQKKIEAAGKLIVGAQDTADQLKETAETLRSAVLKLYQDFQNSQQEVIQRANI